MAGARPFLEPAFAAFAGVRFFLPVTEPREASWSAAVFSAAFSDRGVSQSVCVFESGRKDSRTPRRFAGFGDRQKKSHPIRRAAFDEPFRAD